MRKIAIITGTRADFGLFVPIMREIIDNPELDLQLLVTGMHLSKEFGYTINEIEKFDFPIVAKIDILEKSDTGASMARAVGKAIIGFTNSFEQLKPDLILLLGDRGEMLAAAIAASHMNIPIAHLHGGENSGTIDDLIRNAITKLSSIHLPATEESSNNIISIGENPDKVYMVGAPGLDPIYNKEYASKDQVLDELKINLEDDLLLVVQHPNTFEVEESGNQIRMTLEAISDLKKQTILIYPNSDAGGRKMIKVIKEFESLPFIKTYKNLSRNLYLGVMAISNVIIGNSSSGIIEAPAMRIATVNIGSRQQNRERADSIIDVGYNKDEIKAAIEECFTKSHKEIVRNCTHPYGSGNASKRIVDILTNIPLNRKLVEKK